MTRQKFYQIFSASITSGSTNVFTGNLNLLYKKVTGVYVVITDETGVTKSKFTQFQIDSDDIFPSGLEAILLTTGVDVAPDDKFLKLNERAENSIINMTYVDGAKGTTYPYTLNIYFRLENPEEIKKYL